ncbi:MAG: hypothetical protein ACJ743_10430 [Gaiellaceae bacterium]
MSDPQTEREIRAARNQAMFRAVNEKMTELNASFAELTGTYTIACECADAGCVATLEITPEQYEAVRREPKHFAVLPGHVYPDVERVIEELEYYTVVEKLRAAAEVAELTAQDS